jgi:integrase
MDSVENGRELMIPDKKELIRPILGSAGRSANKAAEAHLFDDYRMRRAEKTILTQYAALILWGQYLLAAGAAEELLVEATDWAQREFDKTALVEMDQYAQSQHTSLPIVYAANYCQRRPEAWQGVTWGLVEGFVKWLLIEGYSLSSVNNRLSAVKVYARLAAKAGVISPTEAALIREVRGYGATEGKRVDRAREQTRVGYKKEEAIVLTAEQARQLKANHPPTPQGIRDRLLLCLLLDLGLRTSEAAALTVSDLDEPGYVTVYRQKTDSTDRMALTADLQAVLADYRPYLRKEGRLLRGSRKNEKLTNQNMSVRAIGGRVKILGRDILGIWELSPHDLRHTWATRAARGSSPFVLRDAGGWTNMQTPGRYVERNQVVNEGIKLDY